MGAGTVPSTPESVHHHTDLINAGTGKDPGEIRLNKMGFSGSQQIEYGIGEAIRMPSRREKQRPLHDLKTPASVTPQGNAVSSVITGSKHPYRSNHGRGSLGVARGKFFRMSWDSPTEKETTDTNSKRKSDS